MILRMSENSESDGRGSSFRLNRPKLLLFLCSAAIIIVCSQLLLRTPLLPDFSNGIYRETFRTDNSSLQRELVLLEKEGFFHPDGSLPAYPAVFEKWRRDPRTVRIFFGGAEPDEAYLELIRASLASAAKTRVVFGTPLENSVAGDLGVVLENCYDSALRREDRNGALLLLEMMFEYAGIILDSNQPDLYFLENAVDSANRFQKTFASDPEEELQLAEVCGNALKENLYPFRGLVEFDRKLAMRDFEKIRLNGIRLFDGRAKSGTVLKDAVLGLSPSAAVEAVETMITDFFYDVDRDQTMNLSLYREILRGGLSPENVRKPTRKMSIRCIRRLIALEERRTAALDRLRGIAGGPVQ